MLPRRDDPRRVAPYAGVMVRWLRAGIEANLDRHGILYPWWVPAVCTLGQVVAVGGSLWARDALWPPGPLLLCVLLVLAPPVVQFRTHAWLPWWIDIAGPVLAAAVLLLQPVDGVVDLAPALLALATAEITARDGLREGLAVALIGGVVIVAAALGPGLAGAPVHTLELVLGFVVGAMLLWQMRALVAERAARERAWDQATTAERERIAREIHDLVAHSLSISLLQVTGARRALRDVTASADAQETADAVAEVDAALSDAEQVGRRAMADIRRTVSAMAEGGTERHALPGGADIAALVREMSGAGLAVEYDEQGDPASLPAATGLGLYRIAQESLANVARHGGTDARARVRLRVNGSSAHLRITNPLPAGRPRGDGLGSGLAGMQARAAQLGATLAAGPDEDGWAVDVRTRSGIELPCGRALRRPGLA